MSLDDQPVSESQRPPSGIKVISLVCESFNRHDAADLKIPGFQKLRFNTKPAIHSDSAIRLLQKDYEDNITIVPDHRRIKWLTRPAWSTTYKEADIRFRRDQADFIGCFVKTRVLSSLWKRSLDIRALDNHCKQPTGKIPPSEADPRGCLPYEELKSFLDGFYQSDYQHLIYWSSIGHVGRRIGKENRGIPETLRTTLATWFDLIQVDILPKVRLDDTIVFIHNDHGTMRSNLEHEQAMFDGFLYAHHPGGGIDWREDREITWVDLRKTLCEIFKIEGKLKNRGGVSLLTGR